MENLNKANDLFPIKFAKHMAKFLPNINKKYLFGENIYNVFLIRDPFKQISSWNAKSNIHQEVYDLNSSGYVELYKLYSDIKRESKVANNNKVHKPIVLDSDYLISNPELALKTLCQLLDIPYYTAQLSWPAGPKPDIDG